jgi:hypothetical protein
LKSAAFLLLRCPDFLLGEVEIPDGRGPALAGQLSSVETYKRFRDQWNGKPD